MNELPSDVETLDRERLIEVVRQTLEPLTYVNAMWLAGSVSFARVDEFSDIDMIFDVADERQGDAFAAIEAALLELAPIAHQLHIPEPAWHGHSQRLYRLHGCPEHLMLDVVIMQRGSTGPRFDQRAIHGTPKVVFDKLGVVTTVEIDCDAHRAAIEARLTQLRERFYLLRHLAVKEIWRGNSLDALWRYHSFVLGPLISLLRIRYAPLFHDFSPRYLKLHLPAPIYLRLEQLSFAADAEHLAANITAAIEWTEDELAFLSHPGAIAALPL